MAINQVLWFIYQYLLDQCGSILTSPVGLITSPNYPEPYPGNEVCNMTIKVAKGPIQVAFQAFDVGSSRYPAVVKPQVNLSDKKWNVLLEY